MTAKGPDRGPRVVWPSRVWPWLARLGFEDWHFRQGVQTAAAIALFCAVFATPSIWSRMARSTVINPQLIPIWLNLAMLIRNVARHPPVRTASEMAMGGAIGTPAALAVDYLVLACRGGDNSPGTAKAVLTMVFATPVMFYFSMVRHRNPNNRFFGMCACLFYGLSISANYHAEKEHMSRFPIFLLYYILVASGLAIVAAYLVTPTPAGLHALRAHAAALRLTGRIVEATAELASGDVDPDTGLLAAATGELDSALGLVDAGLAASVAEIRSLAAAADGHLTSAGTHSGAAKLELDLYGRQRVFRLRASWKLSVVGRDLLGVATAGTIAIQDGRLVTILIHRERDALLPVARQLRGALEAAADSLAENVPLKPGCMLLRSALEALEAARALDGDEGVVAHALAGGEGASARGPGQGAGAARQAPTPARAALHFLKGNLRTVARRVAAVYVLIPRMLEREQPSAASVVAKIFEGLREDWCAVGAPTEDLPRSGGREARIGAPEGGDAGPAHARPPPDAIPGDALEAPSAPPVLGPTGAERDRPVPMNPAFAALARVSIAALSLDDSPTAVLGTPATPRAPSSPAAALLRSLSLAGIAREGSTGGIGRRPVEGFPASAAGLPSPLLATVPEKGGAGGPPTAPPRVAAAAAAAGPPSGPTEEVSGPSQALRRAASSLDETGTLDRRQAQLLRSLLERRSVLEVPRRTGTRGVGALARGWLRRRGVSLTSVQLSIHICLSFFVVMLLTLIEPIYAKMYERPAWAVIAVCVIAEGNSGAMTKKGFLRVVGTVAGAAVGEGILFASILVNGLTTAHRVPKYLATSILLSIACGINTTLGARNLAHTYAYVTCGLTLCGAALAGWIDEPAQWKYGLWRAALQCVGVVVHVLVGLVFFPVDARDSLRDGIAATMDGIGDSVAGILAATEPRGRDGGTARGGTGARRAAADGAGSATGRREEERSAVATAPLPPAPSSLPRLVPLPALAARGFAPPDLAALLAGEQRSLRSRVEDFVWCVGEPLGPGLIADDPWPVGPIYLELYSHLSGPSGKLTLLSTLLDPISYEYSFFQIPHRLDASEAAQVLRLLRIAVDALGSFASSMDTVGARRVAALADLGEPARDLSDQLRACLSALAGALRGEADLRDACLLVSRMEHLSHRFFLLVVLDIADGGRSPAEQSVGLHLAQTLASVCSTGRRLAITTAATFWGTGSAEARDAEALLGHASAWTTNDSLAFLSRDVLVDEAASGALDGAPAPGGPVLAARLGGGLAVRGAGRTTSGRLAGLPGLHVHHELPSDRDSSPGSASTSRAALGEFPPGLIHCSSADALALGLGLDAGTGDGGGDIGSAGGGGS